MALAQRESHEPHVPATMINYGLSEDREAVLDGQDQPPLSPPGPTSLNAFLKHVLVPGKSSIAARRPAKVLPGPAI
jgi:hypothetical protein